MKNALHLFNFFGPLISDCSKLFPFSEPFFALEAIPTLTFALQYAVETGHFVQFGLFESELALESIYFSFLFVLFESSSCLQFLDFLLFHLYYLLFSFIVSFKLLDLSFEALVLLLDEVQPMSQFLDLLAHHDRFTVGGLVFLLLLFVAGLALIWEPVSSEAGRLEFSYLLLEILVFLPKSLILIGQPLNDRPFLAVRMFQLINVLFQFFDAFVLFVAFEGEVLNLGPLACDA